MGFYFSRMKHLLLIPVFFILLCSACSPKIAPSTQKDYISVKEIYTQKEIPGMPDGLIRDYVKMTLEFEIERDVMIDELIFRGKSYVTNSSQKKYKIDINAGSPYAKEVSLKDNEAMLFYTYKGSKQVMTLRNIKTREPLYLP